MSDIEKVFGRMPTFHEQLIHELLDPDSRVKKTGREEAAAEEIRSLTKKVQDLHEQYLAKKAECDRKDKVLNRVLWDLSNSSEFGWIVDYVQEELERS